MDHLWEWKCIPCTALSLILRIYFHAFNFRISQAVQKEQNIRDLRYAAFSFQWCECVPPPNSLSQYPAIDFMSSPLPQTLVPLYCDSVYPLVLIVATSPVLFSCFTSWASTSKPQLYRYLSRWAGRPPSDVICPGSRMDCKCYVIILVQDYQWCG